MDTNESSEETDFVRDDQKMMEILKKVIMSLISIAMMVTGEFIGKDGGDC